MSVRRRRLVVAALASAVLFVGAAYVLGRAIKRSSEPLPSSTPVSIVSEDGAVQQLGGGPDIPELITPTPTKPPKKTTTTGPATTTTTGPATTTGPTTTTTGPTTTGPVTTSTGPTSTTSGTGRATSSGGTTRTSSGGTDPTTVTSTTTG